MWQFLLAQAATTQQACADKISAIHREVVTGMPWGGLRLIWLLAALAVVCCLSVLWRLRTVAINQVRIAQMLERHLQEHQDQPRR